MRRFRKVEAARLGASLLPPLTLLVMTAALIPGPALGGALPSELRDAMDAPGSFTGTLSVSPTDDRSAVLQSLGEIEPIQGVSFAALCTGNISTNPPLAEPGTDMSPAGPRHAGIRGRHVEQRPYRRRESVCRIA